MKKQIALLSVALGMFACTPAQVSVVKTGVDIADQACLAFVPPQWDWLCALSDTAIDAVLSNALTKAPPSAKVVQAPADRQGKIALIISLSGGK